MRRVVVNLVVGVVSIALFCAAVSHLLLPSARPAVYAVTDTASIVEAPSSIGVADSQLYFQTDPAVVNKTLDQLQQLGVTSVRIAIPWAGVEPTPNTYDWSQIDLMVNAAAARGMSVLGVVNSTPVWAGSPAISGHPDPAEYAQFAAAVAQRYGDKIAAYEVWNEPNGIVGYNPVDPAAYTQLLKGAYSAIKAVKPNAIVIGGVLGAGLTWGDLTMNPVDFVEQMYAAGAQGYFDALSFHPYQYTLPFSQGATVPNSPLLQLEAIRDLMAANGDASKLVWLSEYGMPTNVVTEQQQAAYVSDLLQAWQNIS